MVLLITAGIAVISTAIALPIGLALGRKGAPPAEPAAPDPGARAIDPDIQAAASVWAAANGESPAVGALLARKVQLAYDLRYGRDDHPKED